MNPAPPVTVPHRRTRVWGLVWGLATAAGVSVLRGIVGAAVSIRVLLVAVGFLLGLGLLSAALFVLVLGQ